MGRERQLAGKSGLALVASAFFVFMPLAAFSKETGVLLPGYLAIIELSLLRFRGTDACRRAMIALYAIFLVIPVVLGVLYLGTYGQRFLIETHRALGMELGQRLMTEWRVIMIYLFQIIVPMRRNMGFFHDDINLSDGLFEPIGTLASLSGILLLLASAVWTMRRQPLYACGVLLFFAGHALESSVFPLELMFEHRNYLPSFGIILAGTALLTAAVKSKSLRMSLCAITLALLSIVGYSRTAFWSNAATMYPGFYAVHPESERAAWMVAELLSSSGEYDLALRVLDGSDDVSVELHRLHILCRRDGGLPPGSFDLRLLDRQPVPSSATMTTLTGLAQLIVDDTCRVDQSEFLGLLDHAVQTPIAFEWQAYKLLYYAAHLRWRVGDHEYAIALLEDAHHLYPQDPVPLFLATEWLSDMGRRDKASAMFDRATEIARLSRKDFSAMQRAVAEILREAFGDSPGSAAELED
jgi:hypothetical protein